jgi:hypothetical protein
MSRENKYAEGKTVETKVPKHSVARCPLCKENLGAIAVGGVLTFEKCPGCGKAIRVSRA